MIGLTGLTELFVPDFLGEAEYRRRELAADSPTLRIELTVDDEPLYYCEECWQREFADEPV